MRFTDSHEWITPDGKVGITEYAQQELGDIVSIQLPRAGDRVKMGQEVCVLESTKAAADIYAPASGTIIAINEAVQQNPSLLNHPDTWLFQLELANPTELDELLSAGDYQSLIS